RPAGRPVGGVARDGRRAAGALPRRAGHVQVPALGRLRRRAASGSERQALQAPPAPAVLARPRLTGAVIAASVSEPPVLPWMVALCEQDRGQNGWGWSRV